MIHVFPLKGHWPKHCRYYYTEPFVRGLAKKCNYEIINYTILDKDEFKAPRNLIAVAYIKRENEPFISETEFYQIGGIVDTGDLTFTGDYTVDVEKAAEILISTLQRLPKPIKKIGKVFLKKVVRK
ncbi:MAG: hypothetical protein H5T91_10325 [Synergistetes bacterium]|nr:MAG: hypothetical protein XD52_1571 [bacterium 42_11]MBC7332799.1 hypothetical protein [Synergistota bacterium]MDK2871762.1 hypothetical protein [bacterium]